MTTARKDVETMSSKAVFKLFNLSPSIHLVIRAEKLFCGSDLEKDLNYYLKARSVKLPPPQIYLSSALISRSHSYRQRLKIHLVSGKR